MNCSQASHLIDDYLENRLSHRDRSCLEEHLSRCSRCAQELNKRPILEREIRKALTASVLHLELSPAASREIVQASQASLRRAVRSTSLVVAARTTAVTLAAALLVIGLYFLLGRALAPTQLDSVPGFPAIKLPLAKPHAEDLPAADRAIYESTSDSLESWVDGDLLFQPLDLQAGEPFTMTVFLSSDMPQALDDVHLNLDISGPSGYYHFVIGVRGSLPAHGTSLLMLTSDHLARPCQEQYLISSADIFDVPGVYAVHISLSARPPRQSDTQR